jgi:hypothetical protein
LGESTLCRGFTGLFLAREDGGAAASGSGVSGGCEAGAGLGSDACSMPRLGDTAGVRIQWLGHDFGRVQGHTPPAPGPSASAVVVMDRVSEGMSTGEKRSFSNRGKMDVRFLLGRMDRIRR